MTTPVAPPAVEALPAGVPALARAREVVAAAFHDDPLLEWLFPDPITHAEATAAWLGLFVEAFAAGGVVDVVRGAHGTIDGVALWRLGEGEMPFSAAPTVGGLLVALIGPEAAMARGGALRAFAEHKPEPPYHYLQFLAVHPAHQGHGLGRSLVGHGLTRAAAAGTPVYLESTNERNLAFYHSAGLHDVGMFALVAGGPVAYRLGWSP